MTPSSDTITSNRIIRSPDTPKSVCRKRGGPDEWIVGQLGERHYALERHIEQQIYRDDQREAAEHRTRDLTAGIAQLLAEVNRVLIAVVGKDHALHSQRERGQERKTVRYRQPLFEWPRSPAGRGSTNAAVASAPSPSTFARVVTDCTRPPERT